MLQEPHTGHTVDGRNPESHPSPSFIGIIHQSSPHLRSVDKREPPLLLCPTTTNSLSPSQPIELFQTLLAEQLEDNLTPGAAETPIPSEQGRLAARQPAVRAGLDLESRDSPILVGTRCFSQFHRRHDTHTLRIPSVADCPDLVLPTAGFAHHPSPDPSTKTACPSQPTTSRSGTGRSEHWNVPRSLRTQTLPANPTHQHPAPTHQPKQPVPSHPSKGPWKPFSDSGTSNGTCRQVIGDAPLYSSKP